MPSANRSKKPSGGSGSRKQTRPGTGQNRAPSAARDAELARQRGERRRQRLILGAVVVGLVLAVVVAAVGMQAWMSQRPPKPPDTAQPDFGPVTISDGEPIVLGEQDAPVTVGLYEDFKCPHCADLEETLGSTITELQRNGTIKVEIYPMTIVAPDGASATTANAMACAAEEGFGTGYHAGLFANSGLAWSDDQLIELGGLVGDPSPDFADCIRSRNHRSWVDSINRVAEKAGITGTPAVFINGEQKSDAAEWTPDEFRNQIQAAQ